MHTRCVFFVHFMSFELKSINGSRVSIKADQAVVIIKLGEQELLLSTLDTSLNAVYRSPKLAPIDTLLARFCAGSKLLLSQVRVDDLWKQLDENLGRIKHDVQKEKDFIKRLSDIYGISGFEYLPMRYTSSDRRLSFAQNDVRVYGEFQGAGVQRASLILSFLELLEDTALLIEEPETFQHPKATRKLCEHIVELAKKNNIQLFITTHSWSDFLDMLRGIVERQDLRCYLLNRSADGRVTSDRVENRIDEIVRSLYFVPG